MPSFPLVHFIETEQFKTVTIAMRWIGSFSSDTINQRVLMPQVLLAGTKKHRGKQAMQLAFDLNYGSSISANTVKIGRQSVISFQTNVINEESARCLKSTRRSSISSTKSSLFRAFATASF
ncbi:MAG: hypothetical protein MZU97_25215 [Bacillus subtilis]|nr:hypothetical protein [Bacillus subtilis]